MLLDGSAGLPCTGHGPDDASAAAHGATSVPTLPRHPPTISPSGLLASALCSCVWRALPPQSVPHLLLVLELLAACLERHWAACLAQPAAAALLTRLAKLKDLLTKAGGALRGLRARDAVAPLLRAALRVPHLPRLPAPPANLQAYVVDAGDEHAGGALYGLFGGEGLGSCAADARATHPESLEDGEGGDEEAREAQAVGALVGGAQAAVFAYVSATTATSATKLLKALHVSVCVQCVCVCALHVCDACVSMHVCDACVSMHVC